MGFILASEVYHDFCRWPILDRRAFERWSETTGWGRLFLRYAQMGPQGQPPGDPARTGRLAATTISSRIH